jgi:porin
MKLPQLGIESTPRTGARAFLALAAASILGGAPALGAEEIREEPRVRKHEQHSPVSRKVPQELAEETRTPNGLPKPQWQWQHATGDWGGARPQLDEHGVIFELTYTGEVFSNLRGGIDSDDATEYRGNFDLTATLDTERLGLWRGGTFFVYLQNGHGRGISEEYVGDVQTLSNIDAHGFTQISEYWFEQSLFGDRLRVVLGKQDANADFSALDYGGDFINSSFGVIPTVPIPTFPDPALGAAVFLEPADWMALGAGVYDGAPDGGSSGFDTAFDGEGGGFGIVELTLRTSLVDDTWNSGAYRIGVWYHSDDVEEITGAPVPDTFSGSHGIYLAFDQLLFEERADPEDPQGLAAFAQFGWAPDDRSELARYVGGGLIYTGAIPDRDEDVLGVGVAHARFSDRVKELDGRTHETAVEVFYRAQLTPWLSLQPDLQFIANPGGQEEDALTVGLRFGIDF